MTAGLVLATTALRRTARARRGAARDRSRDPAGHGHGPEDADAPAEQRRWAFLGLSAVLTCVTLGLATDGEPRFIYLPVVLLTLLGVRYLTALPRGWGRVAAAACCALAALSVPATAQVVAHQAMPGPHRLSESTVPVARALAAERERTGQPCLAVTGYVPETGWYSGCDALTYADYRQRYPSGPPSDRTVHFVRYENGRLQPGEQALHRLLDGRSAHRRTLPATGTAGGATVLTLPRPAPGP